MAYYILSFVLQHEVVIDLCMFHIYTYTYMYIHKNQINNLVVPDRAIDKFRSVAKIFKLQIIFLQIINITESTFKKCDADKNVDLNFNM